MSSPKNYLIAFLALTTVVGGALAWQQYQELISLRAATMNNTERADWQKRVWAAEKRRHELEDALAALQTKKDGAATDDGLVAGAFDNPAPGRRRGGNMGANFMAMMEKPEIQKLLALQQRGALDSHYAALFKNLNLTPDQLEKFKNLLVEKQTAMADVLAAARAQGMDPRSDPQGFRSLISETQAEIDANIKATLGDAGFAQYQQYQQTLPQRNVVSQLEQSLSYTNTPLTAAQSDQLLQILANNSPATSAGASNRAAVVNGLGIGPGPTARVTDTAVAQSQGVLAPAQVQALQQLQQTQQAQAQLAQAMRNQFGGAAPAAPAAPAGGTSSTPVVTSKGPGG
ncbi:MAG: hypothetical protein JWM88_3009 [Verrucomicrobia bacterium]|nr:hypothetical protein [Verrucomicrobiota bacterium]